MDDNHYSQCELEVTDEMLAAFLDGNASKDETNRVLAAMQCDCEVARILSLSPRIDSEIDAGEGMILPMLALAAANPENLCSFDCEVQILKQLGYDVENWSLLETAKANNWVRENGTPLHSVGRLMELKGLIVERKYDADIASLESALNDRKQVIAIIDPEVLNGGKPLTNAVCHAVCVTGVDSGSVICLEPGNPQPVKVAKETFMKAWKRSGNYLVTAFRNVRGYNPQPINVEGIALDADLEELTEAIAENAHDIWARARMDEGWTYGPVRDDSTKQHPDLIPYAMLPDSEKEYDRIMAMNTLRLVRRLGFNIENGSEA